MTFYVNGIKEENEQKYPVEMVIDVADESFVRKLLEKHAILILSITPFPQDKKTFGDIILTITYVSQIFTIITKIEDSEEAARFFSFLGFDIQKIDSFGTPITERQSMEIITKTKEQAEMKKKDIWKKVVEKEKQERKIYEDEHLESAKKIILKVFEKVDMSLKRAEGIIGMQDMKEITTLTQELKKLRMGTNFEKIRDTITTLFAVIERIDDQYFSSKENESKQISSESLVRETDIEREVEKMENIKILKILHAHISFKNKDYSTFGSSAIFWKFLQKDILYKLANVPKLLSSFYDIAEFVLLIVVCLLAVYALFNQIYLFSFNQFGLAHTLMNVGLWGMVIFAARYFRKRNIGRLLLIIAVAILLHYLLLWAVTTNFAL